MRAGAELHTLTGAYALHALPEAEREEFEQHLAACPSCDGEVAELKATAVRLGLAVSAPAPPEMRDRVLRRIAEVRQEPPRLKHGGRPGAEGPRGGGTSPGLRALPRFALAACLAAAAAFGGIAVWQYESARNAREQAEQTRQQQAELARVLAAPDARTTGRSALPGGATGAVVVSRDRDRAAFLASGMAAPPDGKVYQLWFADGEKMRSAGLMESAGGSDAVLMEGGVGEASAMGITVEPAGGSRRPTSEPLALVELPGA
ncbi:Putative zinc-finger [Streptomyces sp. WMMB 714]|uniref:anti-sigma factor n=1 Tax=Streptomyces sp. WMMB 714 TaxID=1286822 RepID=UPI0005F88D8F|nr:anti-sigma factor [Streptomyces sp. WMMB 714]SCK34252.1 Putative zinc-finger [Streptomyces sp. WMMB 714]